jgi:hypothetical protein
MANTASAGQIARGTKAYCLPFKSTNGGIIGMMASVE